VTNKIKHIGIFTSGGDAPGMNAALFALVKTAERNKIKVSGFRKGFEGLIDNDVIQLGARELQKTMHLGGTILKTARSDRFRSIEGKRQALKNLQKNQIDALVAIGGDGTFRGLLSFSEISNIPCIGIPGTIDNDIMGTDYTLGFDSAVNTAMKCIDNIRDTAESHNRVFIVEVMGRDSGYIGIYSGLAAGAYSILIPENANDLTYLIGKIEHYNSENAFIVVLSEGDELGIELVSSKIREANAKIDIRLCKIGHVQRGGNPSARDRMLGLRLGAMAINSIVHGEKNKMAGIYSNQLNLTAFEHVVKQHHIDLELQSLLKLFCR
jgi:6-phosphofructokinase 1